MGIGWGHVELGEFGSLGEGRSCFDVEDGHAGRGVATSGQSLGGVADQGVSSSGVLEIVVACLRGKVRRKTYALRFSRYVFCLL